jgi:hypothetical protein
MVEAFIFSWITGQLFAWLYLYPRTEQRESRVWAACTLLHWKGAE